MKGVWFFILTLAACLFSSGCIFSPREPEQPSSGEQDNWILPNTPKDVFINLQSGFASSKNSNYERSLDATFEFLPRTEDEANLGQDVFEGWNKDIELQWITRVKGDYPGTRSLHFGDENGQFPIEDIQVGQATFEGPYVMVLDSGDGSGAETYAGIARFKIVHGSTGWVMTLWQDLDINGNFPTSGYLRGTMRSI